MFHHLRITAGLLSIGGLVAAQSFTDVTDAAGLGGPYVFHPANMKAHIMTSGIAVGDYDGDGWDDIFWHGGSGQPARLFRNDQDGTFTDVAAAAGVDVQTTGSQPLWFDYDGDADLDLLLLTFSTYAPGGATVLPSGEVVEAGVIPGPLQQPSATSPWLYRNHLFRNEGDGTFTDVAVEAGLDTCGRWGVAAGDFTGDGLIDLLGVSWLGDATKMMANQGDGTFVDVAPDNVRDEHTRGFSPHLVDMDGDGDVDVFWAGDFLTSKYFRNDGDMVFTEVALDIGLGTDENGMGSNVADFDRDGDWDFFVSSIYHPEPHTLEGWGHTGNRLYVNQGDGTFVDGTDAAGVRDGGWGWAGQFGDIDNDGDLDLVHTNGWYSPPGEPSYDADTLRVFVNDGAGVFTERGAEVGLVDPDQGRGLVLFDYDRDGALDVLVSNNDVGLTLWANDKASVAPNFLEVELRGDDDNVFGIGSTIAVFAGPTRQVAYVECGSNFMSQAPLRATFGLGDHGGPVTVSVKWPDGETQRLEGVAVNQRLVVSRAPSR